MTEPLFSTNVKQSAQKLFQSKQQVAQLRPVKGIKLKESRFFPITLNFFGNDTVDKGYTGIETKICTVSPYKITYLDESAVVSLWRPWASSRQDSRMCITYHLRPFGVDHCGFGQSTCLSEKIYQLFIHDPSEQLTAAKSFQEQFDLISLIKTFSKSDIRQFAFQAKDLGESVSLPYPKLEKWFQTLPYVSSDSVGTQVVVMEYTGQVAGYDGKFVRDSSQLLEVEGFPLFQIFPLELQRIVIKFFIQDSNASALLKACSSTTLWEHLGSIVDPSLHRNITIEKITKSIGYLRGCMQLGTSWYQLIAQFLLENPVVTSTQGARYLKSLKDNLTGGRFKRLLIPDETWTSSYSGVNELGFEHTPEYTEYSEYIGDTPSGLHHDTPMAGAFCDTVFEAVDQLVLAPADWRVRSDSNFPGGVAAESGWGNAWMIQDSIRPFKSVRKLIISLGSNGDHSWLLPSAGLNLSTLTHLHLDVPLPRHFHPGASSLEKFKSFSIPPPSYPTNRLELAPSFHLCPLLGVLAPTLQVLSIHGAGAHVCDIFFDLPWKALRSLRIALNGSEGMFCRGAYYGTRDAAFRLAQRLPELAMHIRAYIPANKEYLVEPYCWGGTKPKDLRRKIPEIETEGRECCMSCAWNLPCDNENLHKQQSCAAMAMLTTLRASISAADWINELAYIRYFHGVDPLRDVQDHCGDVKGDYLRVDLTEPKIDAWLEPCLAPSGEQCGIKRDKNVPWAIGKSFMQKAKAGSHQAKTEKTEASRIDQWLTNLGSLNAFDSKLSTKLVFP